MGGMFFTPSLRSYYDRTTNHELKTMNYLTNYPIYHINRLPIMTREFIRMTGSLRGRAKRSRPTRAIHKQRTTNYKPRFVLPARPERSRRAVRTVFTYCGVSFLRNTVCSSFRPTAALRLEYPVHQLKPAAHRPPLGLSAFLPPLSLTLHPWPITHHSSPPTFYPLPLIIKLAAALALWIYYSHHIAYPACPSPAGSPSAQKYLIMQNKPNLCRFWAKNSYLEEKQTQFKPNQTQSQTRIAKRSQQNNQSSTCCGRRRMASNQWNGYDSICAETCSTVFRRFFFRRFIVRSSVSIGLSLEACCRASMAVAA